MHILQQSLTSFLCVRTSFFKWAPSPQIHSDCSFIFKFNVCSQKLSFAVYPLQASAFKTPILMYSFQRKQMACKSHVSSSETSNHLLFISLKHLQAGCGIRAAPHTYFIPAADNGNHSLSPILACSYWPAPWICLPTETMRNELPAFVVCLKCVVADPLISLMVHLLSGIINGAGFPIMFCSCSNIETWLQKIDPFISPSSINMNLNTLHEVFYFLHPTPCWNS